ncbi:MAG: hypothetical protein AAGA25_17485, partial [Planctomycetota bacterium]
MPRPSRYRRNTPFSLFAFQDIIAAVTGVMLLATLLLMLELVTQTLVANAAPVATDDAVNTQERASLEAKLEQLLTELSEESTTVRPGIIT